MRLNDIQTRLNDYQARLNVFPNAFKCSFQRVCRLNEFGVFLFPLFIRKVTFAQFEHGQETGCLTVGVTEITQGNSWIFGIGGRLGHRGYEALAMVTDTALHLVCIFWALRTTFLKTRNENMNYARCSCGWRNIGVTLEQKGREYK